MTNTCIGCGRSGGTARLRITGCPGFRHDGLFHEEGLCDDCADLLILNRCDLIAAIKEIIR